MGTRTAERRYRPSAAAALEELERRRRRAGVTQRELCDRAGLDVSSYRRMLRAGLAFPRRIVAIRMALRELEKMRRQRGRLFAPEQGP